MIRLGLLGAKLGHSISPQIHQAVADRLGISLTYELLEVPAEELPAKVRELLQSYRGVNVTIPHKVAVLPELDWISPEAAAIGAVNTIFFHDGRAEGYNTDYSGFSRLLAHNGLQPRDKRVCVLGTGGASRAILQCLQDEGAASIHVISRHPDTAPEDLRERFAMADYDQLRQLEGDLLVNCTPVGMFPKVDASPVDAAVVDKFGATVDIIYNPAETQFLRLARNQGKPAVNGLYMLVAQAVRSEEIWLGRTLGDDLIDAVVGDVRNLL
jgi:shikimate dehydrogenase